MSITGTSQCQYWKSIQKYEKQDGISVKFQSALHVVNKFEHVQEGGGKSPCTVKST